jgi:hypothetical protein
MWVDDFIIVSGKRGLARFGFAKVSMCDLIGVLFGYLYADWNDLEDDCCWLVDALTKQRINKQSRIGAF